MADRTEEETSSYWRYHHLVTSLLLLVPYPAHRITSSRNNIYKIRLPVNQILGARN